MERSVLFALILITGASSMSVQLTDPATCNLCKAGVTELKVIDQDENTRDLLSIIQNFLCANVPIEDCDNWMTNEIALLHSTVQGLDATEACTYLGVCSTRIAGPLGDEGTIQCDFCHFMGDELKKRVLTNATIDQVIAATKVICSELPFVSNECSALVDEYGHYYLDLLVGKIDVEQLCVKVGLCDAKIRAMIENTELFQVIYKNLKDDEECKACMDGMDIIKTVVGSDDMKDLLHVAAKELCSLVSFSGCEVIMDTGIDELLNKLLPMIEPSTVCKQFGACPAVAEVMTTLPAAPVGDDQLCEACHDVLGEVKKTASDPEVATIASDLAPVICELISIPFCNNIISKLLMNGVNAAKALDVDGTCVDLGACPAATVIPQIPAFGSVCDECAMIGDLVLKELQDPEIQKEIEDALSQVCAVLPIADCQETIHSYVAMIETILSTMDGKTMCSYFGLCSAAPIDFVKEVTEPKLGDTCSECTLIAGAIIQVLDNEEADNLIKEGIAELCTVLPISDCASTLDGYFDQVLAIIKNLDGKTICSLVGLCG